MCEWRAVKLEEVIKFGNGRKKPGSNGNIPIYGGNGILGYSADANYNDETIIIGRVGAYCGSVYYENNPIWVSDNALSAKPKNDNNTKFLYYFLKEARLNQHAGGSSHPLVTQTLLNSLEYYFCSNSTEQKAIAEVLSSLDDKIDLLHRQNKTLEELAQTLFRQWFVEEANDEWEKCKLSDVLEIKYGKDHKKLADGNIPVYGSGGIMRYADSFLYDQESILIPRKGTLTNLFYIDEPFWTVDTIFWSKINTEKVSGKFLFFFLKTMDLSNLNVGSAVPSLTTKVLNEIKISIPSIDEQKKFNEYTDNAWEKMTSNKKQIKILENMRDTLLPKLMSGEVRVTNG